MISSITTTTLSSGTQGDVVPITMYQSDGVTSFVPTAGYTSVVVAVMGPLNVEVSYTPTSVVSNVVNLTTVVAMFPTGGTYRLQPVFTYANGNVIKAGIAIITVVQALI